MFNASQGKFAVKVSSESSQSNVLQVTIKLFKTQLIAFLVLLACFALNQEFLQSHTNLVLMARFVQIIQIDFMLILIIALKD